MLILALHMGQHWWSTSAMPASCSATRNYVLKLRLAFHTSSFPRFPVLRFPPLQYMVKYSGSTIWYLIWCRIFQSRIFSAPITPTTTPSTLPYWLSGTNRQTVSNTHNHLDDGPPYITIHADKRGRTGRQTNRHVENNTSFRYCGL